MGSSVLARNSSIHPAMPKPHLTAVSRTEVAKMSAEPLLRSSERTAVATNQMLARQAMMPSPIARVSQPRRGEGRGGEERGYDVGAQARKMNEHESDSAAVQGVPGDTLHRLTCSLWQPKRVRDPRRIRDRSSAQARGNRMHPRKESMWTIVFGSGCPCV